MTASNIVSFVLAILLILLAPSALAQPAPSDPIPVVQPAESEDTSEVVGAIEGERIPFNGLLMTEARFLAYAGQQIRITELEGRLEIREKLLRETAADLAEARLEHEAGWFTRNAFWLGTIFGAAIAGFVVWGAVEVLDARASP